MLLVLKLLENTKVTYIGEFEYLVISLADTNMDTIIPKARQTKEFIDR